MLRCFLVECVEDTQELFIDFPVLFDRCKKRCLLSSEALLLVLNFLQVYVDPLYDLDLYQFLELVERVTANQQHDFDVCLVGRVEGFSVFVLEPILHLDHLCEVERGQQVEDLFSLGGCVSGHGSA